MTKKNITNKVIGIGTGLTFGILPLNSHAQDYNKIQKGVNAPTYVTETPTHVVFHSNFNKDLQRAIKSSSKPSIYLTGDKESYVIFDSDTTGCNLYYSKKNFNEFGEGEKRPLLHIKGDEHMNPCDSDGLGSKTNHLVSYYFKIYNQALQNPEKLAEPTPKENNEQNSFINNYNNTTINNNGISAEELKRIFDSLNTKKKDSKLELRLLLDGSKDMNPNGTLLENPYWNVSAISQFRLSNFENGSIWFGPYARVGIGKETESFSEHIYEETLLNQASNLSTITEGIRNSNKNTSYPMEIGAQLSIDSKMGLLRVDFFGGATQENVELSDVIETGYDWISQNGNIVGDKKPYEVIKEKGNTTKKFIPIGGVSGEIHPGKGRHFYIGGGAQLIGKTDSKPSHIIVNARTGVKFGGGRRK